MKKCACMIEDENRVEDPLLQFISKKPEVILIQMTKWFDTLPKDLEHKLTLKYRWELPSNEWDVISCSIGVHGTQMAWVTWKVSKIVISVGEISDYANLRNFRIYLYLDPWFRDRVRINNEPPETGIWSGILMMYSQFQLRIALRSFVGIEYYMANAVSRFVITDKMASVYPWSTVRNSLKIHFQELIPGGLFSRPRALTLSSQNIGPVKSHIPLVPFWKHARHTKLKLINNSNQFP